jgi:hypothetical protein
MTFELSFSSFIRTQTDARDKNTHPHPHRGTCTYGDTDGYTATRAHAHTKNDVYTLEEGRIFHESYKALVEYENKCKKKKKNKEKKKKKEKKEKEKKRKTMKMLH